jgi:hypothetical protein
MIKIVDVFTALLVEELERQQGQDRAGSGDHFRAKIVRLGDDSVGPQFGQKWQEQEDPSVARFPPSSAPDPEAVGRRREVLPGRSGLHIAVDREVDLDHRGQKGGNAPPAILGVNSTDHHLEGEWLVTEPRGDLSHGRE